MQISDGAADNYFVIKSKGSGRMMLWNPSDGVGDASWTSGNLFRQAPPQPVLMQILAGYEQDELPDFKLTPTVMSSALHDVLLKAGVDNIDVYDAIIASEDGSIRHEGFKAYNLIGVVSATDFAKTVFSPSNPSRAIDASIDSLAIDVKKVTGVLMFRLAENTSVILVHPRVKEALEAANFESIYFMAPGVLLTL